MKAQENNLMVNGRCLLFFDTPQPDTDVMDSMLYAQLAASKKHSVFSDHAHWKKVWRDAAFFLGWSYQASLSLDQPVPCKQASSLWDWVRAMRPEFVSEALLEQSETAMQYRPLQQPAFTAFAGQVLAPDAKTMAMQMGMVDSEGGLTMMQLYFDCHAPLSSNSLFGPWDQGTVKGNIKLDFYRLLLSSDPVYVRRREEGFKKLEGHRKKYISPVQGLTIKR